MKRIALILTLSTFVATAAQAGGVVTPVMEPAVIAQDTASSGGDNWVGFMLILLAIATAVSN